jgi:hypothetical protein
MHFSVLVFTEDGTVDGLMEQYGQDSTEHMEFQQELTEKQAEKKFKTETKDAKSFESRVKTLIEYRQKGVKYYMETEYGYSYDSELKAYGYNSNPNARWDWFVIGGRWKNMLITKSGEICDSALVDDLDLDAMLKHHKEEYAKYWDGCKTKEEFLAKKTLGGMFYEFNSESEGWSTEEELNTDDGVREVLDRHKGYYVTVVDCHM